MVKYTEVCDCHCNTVSYLLVPLHLDDKYRQERTQSYTECATKRPLIAGQLQMDKAAHGRDLTNITLTLPSTLVSF